MFNNLIESSSHTQELKRRGSFLLFTGATYVVLLLITGVVSIYAYEAHLESQTTELEMLTWVPQPPTESAPAENRSTIRPSSNTNSTLTRAIRIELIDSTSNPNNPPPNVGTLASPVPPAPRGAVLGPINADPPAPPSGGHGIPGGTGNTPVVELPDAPPPVPAPMPVVPRVLRVSQVLNSQAISLPKPIYPPLAKQARVQGRVTVQVLIDETGKVISAKAVSGHPLLIVESQRAAMQARFSPTLIGEQPVKVSGVITYNFVML